MQKRRRRITSVDENRSSTSMNTPTTIRLTPLDESQMALMVERLQAELPGKKITRSRVIRAFGHLHEDKTVMNKLRKSLLENT